MNTDRIDFDSAAHAINQDSTYFAQQDNLCGLYDFGESPDNSIVSFPTSLTPGMN